jgi:peptidoglycan/xylan/chitin deacetylase (PgdA/CDA1 family)
MIFLALVVLILLVLAGIWVAFNPSISIYSRSRGPATDEKIIALTFDDGPDAQNTPLILKTLRDANVKATFFVVGKNVRAHPDTLHTTHAQGHLIGNHSGKHTYGMLPRLNKTVLRDINETNETITTVIAQTPTFYRPPFGFRTPWSARLIRKAGYHIVTWDDMTTDYWGLPTEKLVHDILNKARPGGIIVMHDGAEGLARGTSHVPDALPKILDELKRQGYRFVLLDELFDTPGYRV